MDKIFTSLIIGLLCCVSQLSAQQPTFTITPQTANAQVNDIIEFDVEVSNFNNIATFQYGINWNPAILEFVDISSINASGTTGFPALSDPPNGNGTFSKPGGNVPPGQLGVSWFNPSFTGITRPDGTLVFSFRLRAKAGGTSQVEFAIPPVPSIEVLNGNFQNVGLNAQNSTVTVAGGSGPANVNFAISDGSVQQGQQVCLNVTVSDFTNIGSVELSIDYNSSSLQFASVSGISLSGLQQSNFNTSTPGTITLDWSSANGVTLSNGITLFQLCFTALQTGSSSVSFAGAPLAINVLDGGGNDVTFNGDDGSVSVTPIPTGTDFKLSIEDKTVNSGDDFCLKVTTENFTDVVGFAFTLNYNSSMLQFTQVTNLNPNIQGFSVDAHFGTPSNGLSPGFITVNYFNLSLAGADLPNGAVLFELCFKAIGSGATQINFTSDITQIEISDSNQEIIDFNGDPGNVSISGGPPPPPPTDDFRLTIADANIDPGDQFCVEVTVDNFTDVVGMAFTINYDAGNLQFQNVGNLNPNIPSFDVAANFGTPNSGLNPGFITVNYFNQDLTGIDLPNGAVLFEMCFTEIGGPGAESDIVFTSDIAQIEISDSSQEVIPFTSEEGTIAVSGTFQGFRLTIEDVTVAPNEEFCLEVTAENFADIVGFAFTMNYDPNELEFMSVGNLNPNVPGFSIDAHFGSPDSGLNPGFVTVNYFNLDLTGVNLPTNAVLFELCFRANGLSGACSDIFFTSDITQIEVSDSNQDVVDFNSRRGTVCIDDTVPGQVRLTAGDATVDIDQNFCIPVRARGFNDITKMTFTMNYNASELQFNSVSNLAAGLPGFTVSNSFGTPGNGTSTGVITVNWTGTAGVSLPDNTVLFQLCFTATGQNGNCSDVNFVGNPTAIEFRNSFNDLLPFNGRKGTACINPAFDGFLLTVRDEVVEPDEQFCVPITVLNFEDVVGLAFTLNYDDTQLQFNQVTNLNTNMPNFTLNNNIATPPAIASGHVTMNWYDLSLSPVNLNNGEVLFEICFTAIGDDGQVSDITFSSDITPIEVSDSNQEVIPFNGEEGTITISAIQPPVINTPTINHVSCNGGSNGLISISVSGGTGGPYGFNWSGPGGPYNTPTITSLSAGTYNLTVTDVNSTLTTTATYTITQPGSSITIVGNSNAPSCQGGSDGSIMITATGGTPGTATPYTYSWSGNIPGSTPNPINLPMGTYTVTVTDANGCTQSRSFLVPAGSGSNMAIAATVEDVACAGEADGSICLTVTGGQGSLTYSWAPSAVNGSCPGSLSGGNYSVTVYDDGGCFTSQSFSVQEPAQPLDMDITGNPIESGGDGIVRVDVSGGSMPYTYDWRGPNSTAYDTPEVANLDAVGEYCVTVTDGNDCTTTGCYNLEVVVSFGNVDIIDACGGSNGSISISMIGGQRPYSFNWAGLSTTDSIASGLSGGTYFVTVTDVNGIEVSGQFDIDESPGIVLGPVYTPITGSPSDTNGEINISPSGGTGMLTYNWSTGDTGTGLAGLGEGQYCVTVTDAIGCAADTCFNMVFRPEFEPPSVVGQNTSCADTEDGALTVDIQGGLFPYSVVITYDSGEMFAFATSELSFTQDGLPPGSGTIEITDVTGETLSQAFTVGSPDALAASVQDFLHDTEDAGCSGMIQLDISGGTGGYSVSWSSGDVGATLNNICGDDSYQPTITDANGCSVTLDPIALNVFRLDVTGTTDTDCPDTPAGAVNIDVSGGEPGYTYVWTDESGNVVFEGEDLSGVVAGDYTVMVTEPSGNTLTEQVAINSTSNLQLSVDVMSNYNGFDVSCADAADGQALATASGSSGYSYEWTLDNVLVSTEASLANAEAGAYRLMLIDGDGCTVTRQVVLDAPEALDLTATVNGITCHGGKDASITVFASGGVPIPGINYAYQWSNGGDINRISALPAGDYTVTVFDGNNCSTDASFTVEDPAPLAVSFETEPASDGCNGTARVVIEGGAEPFLYEWANVDAGTNQDLVINLCPGEYFLQVTDANDCPSELNSVTVDDRRFPCLEERVVITPDGNGVNDEFLIFCVGEYPDNHLEIYNRWGQLVFEADNYDNTWEGTNDSGQALPEGPYYYVLEYTDPEGNLVQQKGSLTILREN
ncbi:MAG: gliding motility-associated C-terminal domain-containing protein [Lewinellaceae bacterium]|nr:gliding motility-associated C-terminal domain-containing protein [Phaeodactylibacter sp.]MCB9039747.1 gliding motility-associated C-terminal domain-containing protein [Lewinellaceae bacterium]